jgi:uncharacterized membrane protein
MWLDRAMDTSASSATSTVSQRTGLLSAVLLGAVVVIAAVFAFSGSALVPNNWYAAFKAIHVAVAVYWVGGGLLLTTLGIRAQRAKDPNEIVSLARQAAFAGEKIFAPAGLVVLAMGVAMLINTDLGWGHFWIVVGLIGYASTFAVGIGVLSPLAKKITESAEQNGPTHPTTLALIDRILLIARFDVAVLLLVVVDMVTKPFA